MPETTAEKDALNALITRYFAAWNETDDATRRALIAETWAEDASYQDPMVQGTGRDGINAMIAAVQAQYPGFRFRQTGEVDTHNANARFTWEFGPAGSAAVAGGVDFAQIAGNRLQTVVGFLDFVPGGA